MLYILHSVVWPVYVSCFHLHYPGLKQTMPLKTKVAVISVMPVPQISEGFRATTNNYEENIVWSIGWDIYYEAIFC